VRIGSLGQPPARRDQQLALDLGQIRVERAAPVVIVDALKAVDDRRGVLVDLVALLGVHLGHRLEQLGKARPPEARLGRKVRAEVVLPIEGFKKMNKERIAAGEDPYRNPRNTASGSLKLQDSAEVAKRPLECLFYQVLTDCRKLTSHYESLSELRKAGFKDIQLAVNVFAYQIMNNDFVRNVRKALAESNLHPRNLTLELSESVVTENAKKLVIIH